MLKEKGCWTLKRRILSKKDWWRWKKTPYLLKLLIKNISPDISILLSNNSKSLVFSLKTLYSHHGLCQHEDKWYWTCSRIKTLDEFWFLKSFFWGLFLLNYLRKLFSTPQNQLMCALIFSNTLPTWVKWNFATNNYAT